ncbi:MAG: hypothetical protein ACK4ND_02810 [Cytophagaceae bacterium]
MKAYKSPLVLQNFFLLNHSYHFIEPQDDKNVDISEILNNYNIDIDFSFKNISENLFQLFTKININDLEKPFPGYVLFIEGVCIFSFDKQDELTDQEKSNLLHVSGLNICINSLRNNLTITTANGPFGKYILPSIDVNKLLIDKQAQVTTNKSRKESK